MQQSLVFTFIANDKPGIVDKLSSTVARHQGNWLESRMTKLAGKFAGIVQISLPAEQTDALKAALTQLACDDVAILIDDITQDQQSGDLQTLKLSILGLDRPGIVREVAQALAAKQLNVSEMHSVIESAPMTGEPLFKAEACLQAPANTQLDDLQDNLETICAALDLEWSLETL